MSHRGKKFEEVWEHVEGFGCQTAHINQNIFEDDHNL